MSTIDNDDQNPRFTKAFLGRILAVIAFVCLGTFAVVQSVTGDRSTGDDTNVEADADSGLVAQKTDSKNDIETTPGSGQPAQPLTAKPKTSFGTAALPKSKSFTNPPPPAKSFGSNANKSTVKEPTQGFGAANKTPANKTPATANQKPKLNNKTFVAKPSQEKEAPPAAKSLGGNSFGAGNPSFGGARNANPPERYAMRQDENNSFGGLTAKPSNPLSGNTTPNNNAPANGLPTEPPKSLNGFANNLQSKANDTASNLLKGVRENTTKAANEVQNKINEATDGFKNSFSGAGNALRDGFNPAPNKSLQQNSRGLDSTPQPKLPSTTPKINSLPTQNQHSPFDSQPNLKPSGNSVANQPAQRSFQNSFGSAKTSPVQTSPNGTTPTPNPFDEQNRPATSKPLVRNAPSSTQSAFGTQSMPSRQRFNSSAATTGQPTNARPASTSKRVDSAGHSLSTPGDRQLEGVQAPSLTVEKIAPREIQLNQPAEFELIVRNTGRIHADNVQVTDRVPAGTELISAQPQPQRSGMDDLLWNLGTMRAGQEKRIKLQLRPTRPGEIGSVANVTFSTQASMRTLVTKPMIEVRQSGPARVLVGDDVLLDIVIENKGDGPATNVMLEENVPQQLSYRDGLDREIEYPVGTIAPGQRRTIRLPLKAAKIGTLRNVIFASADGGLSSQHAIDMEVIAPQLVTRSTGPRRRYLQREATHQFSVENTGTAKATNVELIGRLPRGLRFVTANNRGKYDPNTHAVYWSLAELTPSMVANVEVKTMPVEAGNQDIEFEAAADLNQKSTATQPLMVEHLIDVFFEIDDVVDPIEVGSPTSYRIRIVNQGTKTATNVRVQVDFPAGIIPTSVDGSLSSEIRGQQVLFAPITSINPGDEIKFTVNGKGSAPGDHLVVVRLQTDGRQTNVSKEETTHVYQDR